MSLKIGDITSEEQMLFWFNKTPTFKSTIKKLKYTILHITLIRPIVFYAYEA